MISRTIISFAALLGTTACFLVTMIVMAAFGLAGGKFGFSDAWVTAFTLILSIWSIVQTSVILVAQRHAELEARSREAAMHAKLDSLLIGVDKADDKLVGIEREIEADA